MPFRRSAITSTESLRISPHVSSASRVSPRLRWSRQLTAEQPLQETVSMANADFRALGLRGGNVLFEY
jgi:hypothetical protein